MDNKSYRCQCKGASDYCYFCGDEPKPVCPTMAHLVPVAAFGCAEEALELMPERCSAWCGNLDLCPHSVASAPASPPPSGATPREVMIEFDRKLAELWGKTDQPYAQAYGWVQSDWKQAIAAPSGVAEPVAWQMRTKMGERDWSRWEECADCDENDPREVVNGPMLMQFRPLYAAPIEAEAQKAVADEHAWKWETPTEEDLAALADIPSKAVARIKRGAQTQWGFAGILVDWLPGLQDLPPGEHKVYAESQLTALRMELAEMTEGQDHWKARRDFYRSEWSRKRAELRRLSNENDSLRDQLATLKAHPNVEACMALADAWVVAAIHKALAANTGKHTDSNPDAAREALRKELARHQASEGKG